MSDETINYYKELAQDLAKYPVFADDLIQEMVKLAADNTKPDLEKYTDITPQIMSYLVSLQPDLDFSEERYIKVSEHFRTFRVRNRKKADKTLWRLRGQRDIGPVYLAWFFNEAPKAGEWMRKLNKVFKSSYEIKKVQLNPEFKSKPELDKFLKGKKEQKIRKFRAKYKTSANRNKEPSDEVSQLETATDSHSSHELFDIAKLSFPTELYRSISGISNNYPTAFKSQNTEFLGRDTEYEKLRHFLEAKPAKNNRSDFLWWQIAGSAGQGKSRLALQLVDDIHDQHTENGKFWEAGFIKNFDDLFLKKLDSTSLERPLLLVLDYVAAPARTARLSILIAKLNDISIKNACLPVRLLVVERQPLKISSREQEEEHSSPELFPNTWHHNLLSDFGGQVSAEAKNALYSFGRNVDEVLFLQDINDDKLIEIANSWASQIVNRRLSKLEINLVKEIVGIELTPSMPNQLTSDNRPDFRKKVKRPLFAILAAKAVLDKNSDFLENSRTLEDLLKYTLYNEARELFGTTTPNVLIEDIVIEKTTDNAQNLAVLSNMVGILEYSSNERSEFFLFNKNIKFEPLISSDEIKDAYRILGISIHAKTVKRIKFIQAREPDILAEYQVLLLFEKIFRLEELTQDSWKISSEGTFGFLFRLIEDFPLHPTSFRMLNTIPHDIKLRPIWAQLISEYLMILSQFDEVKKCQALAHSVISLAVQDISNHGYSNPYVEAIGNAFQTLLANRVYTSCEELYNTLKIRNSEQSPSYTVSCMFARCLFECITHFCEIEDFPTGYYYYQELYRFRIDRPYIKYAIGLLDTVTHSYPRELFATQPPYGD